MEERDTQALLNEWLERADDPEIHDELAALKAGDADAVVDAFFQDLTFGTAGLRGIIGAGTNRMNIYTVGRATQGVADYLTAHYENPSVLIGRDSRNKGVDFMRRAAAIFAANGVTVYLYPRIEPVPAVSFGVRELGCSGGVCITASHNPAPYNGYKVYGDDGCQIATEVSQDMAAAIDEVDYFDVKTCDFDEAVADGRIKWVGDQVLEHFIDAVARQSVALPEDCDEPLRVVYTPLNGTGLECVSAILERCGIDDVTVVPEQAYPDGDFPTCPYPNPEIREALEKGIELCKKVHPDLLLATDPDADRVGIACEDGDDYLLLSGNETGVLLLDYIARMHQQRGENLVDKIAVTTIVSSVMVDALAAEYGFTVKRVLTGFKYIGSVIGDLERKGQVDRFIFGFEESYGYLNGPHVRDKDGVDASMLICQMTQWYKRHGISLAEAMRALYEKHGYYLNRTLSFAYPGEDGQRRMGALMDAARSEAPDEFASLRVQKVVDYASGVDGLPAANVVEYDLEGSNKVIFRPSGTEPKIKAYVFAKETTRAAAEQLLETLAAEATATLQA
ncbi:MAG: phospho-sugar mutase [Eggerthellaceae bacterium]